MYEMQQQGVNYLIRMREDWWLDVRKILKNGETRNEVTFTLPKAERDLLNQYSTGNNKIKCRLIAVQLAEGAWW